MKVTYLITAIIFGLVVGIIIGYVSAAKDEKALIQKGLKLFFAQELYSEDFDSFDSSEFEYCYSFIRGFNETLNGFERHNGIPSRMDPFGLRAVKFAKLVLNYEPSHYWAQPELYDICSRFLTYQNIEGNGMEVTITTNYLMYTNKKVKHIIREY